MHEDKLRCGQLHQVTEAADLSSLPDNAVVLQSHPVSKQPDSLMYSLVLPDQTHALVAVGANFGQALHQAGRCKPEAAACDLSGKQVQQCSVLSV